MCGLLVSHRYLSDDCVLPLLLLCQACSTAGGQCGTAQMGMYCCQCCWPVVLPVSLPILLPALRPILLPTLLQKAGQCCCRGCCHSPSRPMCCCAALLGFCSCMSHSHVKQRACQSLYITQGDSATAALTLCMPHATPQLRSHICNSGDSNCLPCSNPICSLAPAPDI